MKYIKAFIAGIAFPSVLLPVFILILLAFGKSQVLSIPILHFIPIFWGIWNLLFFKRFSKIDSKKQNSKVLLTGGVLGILLALYGVFVVKLPELLGFPNSIVYLPLFIAPILYAFLWLYIVHPINILLDVYKK